MMERKPQHVHIIYLMLNVSHFFAVVPFGQVVQESANVECG